MTAHSQPGFIASCGAVDSAQRVPADPSSDFSVSTFHKKNHHKDQIERWAKSLYAEEVRAHGARRDSATSHEIKPASPLLNEYGEVSLRKICVHACGHISEAVCMASGCHAKVIS